MVKMPYCHYRYNYKVLIETQCLIPYRRGLPYERVRFTVHIYETHTNLFRDGVILVASAKPRQLSFSYSYPIIKELSLMMFRKDFYRHVKLLKFMNSQYDVTIHIKSDLKVTRIFR